MIKSLRRTRDRSKLTQKQGRKAAQRAPKKRHWFFGKEGHPPIKVMVCEQQTEQSGVMGRWSSLKEHMENALASGAEEGRDKLR